MSKLRFEYGKDVLVKYIAKDPSDGDGQDVNIYECHMPAVFHTIEALPTPDALGRAQKGFTLQTGSGQEKLIKDIAKAISEGMLGLK